MAAPFFVQIALPLAEKGLRVFPLNGKTKEPIPGFMGHQKKATTSRDQILKWGNKYPESNVGVHSDLSVGGYFFVESDTADAMKIYEEKTRKKINTFTVESSPGRTHMYLRHTPYSVGLQKNIPENTAGGFSLRTKNYYVAGPGSVHPKTQQPYRVTNDAPIADVPDDFVDFVVSRAAEVSGESATSFFKDPRKQNASPSGPVVNEEPPRVFPKKGPKTDEELDHIADAFIDHHVPSGVVEHGGHDNFLHSLAGKLREEGGRARAD